MVVFLLRNVLDERLSLIHLTLLVEPGLLGTQDRVGVQLEVAGLSKTLRMLRKILVLFVENDRIVVRFLVYEYGQVFLLLLRHVLRLLRFSFLALGSCCRSLDLSIELLLLSVFVEVQLIIFEQLFDVD